MCCVFVHIHIDRHFTCHYCHDLIKILMCVPWNKDLKYHHHIVMRVKSVYIRSYEANISHYCIHFEICFLMGMFHCKNGSWMTVGTAYSGTSFNLGISMQKKKHRISNLASYHKSSYLRMSGIIHKNNL